MLTHYLNIIISVAPLCLSNSVRNKQACLRLHTFIIVASSFHKALARTPFSKPTHHRRCQRCASHWRTKYGFAQTNSFGVFT